jgi:uncharacterized membrane protein (DUF4010 family)
MLSVTAGEETRPILIAALSFAGYVAIRLAGPSIGVLLSGLAGCR